jgi:eukaryotic-like serine/threonine-protein kinase
MLSSWALAFAERWALPKPAFDEMTRVLGAISRGEIAAGDVETLMEAPSADESPSATPLPALHAGLAGRYEDINQIGLGGMGEVRRVWDMSLNRALAMKILRREYLDRPDLFARFREEAEATSQLEHPGIVPIHDIGKLPDGRLFFTMKEVRGRTLLDVIDEIHGASTNTWCVSASGWTLYKTVQVFVDVCEAIAYAHSRDVLHRDLKPSNVMVGAFGEVVVMDWGLAKIGTDTSAFGDSVSIDSGAAPIMTERSRASAYLTVSGSVAGTPNYMPPEQARGEHTRVGPWSDVYALGAILYHILSDRPPYDGIVTEEVIEKVLAGPPPPAGPRWRRRRGTQPSLEDGLIAICNRAMSPQISDRYMDAATLAEAVNGWLEGARTRAHALSLVRRAEVLEPVMEDLRRRSATLRSRSSYLLAGLPPSATSDDKRVAWGLQDDAAALSRELKRESEHYANLLRAALTHAPDLGEARVRLHALEPSQKREGRGYLSLDTDPGGARVLLRRVEIVDRRMTPTTTIDLGLTPLDRVEVASGPWLVQLSWKDTQVDYPVFIEPGEHWDGVPPGAKKAHVIPMEKSDDPEEVVIAGSWCRCGGDIETLDTLSEQQIWVDDFAMKRHPVTAGAYLVFLAAIAEPEAHIPHTRRGTAWTRDASGWTLPDGVSFEQPVTGITLASAAAFARWQSERDGLPWRLPTEFEWEKAARGVDFRRYPWGNHVEPEWCCTLHSQRDEPHLPSVDAYPLDLSPYGVRGMGGHVRDWCIPCTESGDVAIARGGHWLSPPSQTRCALRHRVPFGADETVGFRLVRSIP